MKSIVIILISFLSVGTINAQDTISGSEAKNFIGKKVTLCDRVNYGRYLEVSKPAPVRLFVGPDYPDHYLTLVFPDQKVKRFSFDPEKKMVNKRFCVHGTITKYRGKPAIFVTSEAQLNEED